MGRIFWLTTIWLSALPWSTKADENKLNQFLSIQMNSSDFIEIVNSAYKLGFLKGYCDANDKSTHGIQKDIDVSLENFSNNLKSNAVKQGFNDKEQSYSHGYINAYVKSALNSSTLNWYQIKVTNTHKYHCTFNNFHVGR